MIVFELNEKENTYKNLEILQNKIHTFCPKNCVFGMTRRNQKIKDYTCTVLC